MESLPALSDIQLIRQNRSVCDYLLGLLVKYMNLGSLDTEGHFASGSCFRSRIDARGHVCAIDGEIQEYLCAEQLIDLDLCLDRRIALCNKLRIIIQVLRTDTEDNRLSDISTIYNLLRLLSRDFSAGR